MNIKGNRAITAHSNTVNGTEGKRISVHKPYKPNLEELVNYSIPFLTAKNASMYLQYNKKNNLFECFYLNGKYVCSFMGYYLKDNNIMLENLSTKNTFTLEINKLIPLKNA